MNGRDDTGTRSEFRKETVEKDDGRYIIFYSFERSEKEEDDGKEAGTEDNRDGIGMNGEDPRA